MLFLVQPKDFACTTGLMGSFTLLLPPRSYALLHVTYSMLTYKCTPPNTLAVVWKLSYNGAGINLGHLFLVNVADGEL